MRNVTAVIALTFIALAVPGRASDVVELRFRGHYYAAPATIVVNVAVEPNAENRKLLIEADSDRFYRGSEVTLEGEKEKRIHTFEFKSLPEGDYTFVAEVLSENGSRGRATQDVTVMGVGGQ